MNETNKKRKKSFIDGTAWSPQKRLQVMEELSREYYQQMLRRYPFKPFVKSFKSFEAYERWKRRQKDPWINDELIDDNFDLKDCQK